MNTIRLYEQDAYLQTFTAQVVSCEQGKKNYQVVLDRTAFFPEGGGQPADTGVLGGVRVLDAHIKDDIITHYTDKPLTVGETVTGTIDWNHRFDLMQAHSGEHIVSGIVNRRFGYDNVGFHMGEQIQVDWNGPITPEELAEIELEANRVIWQDRETEITVPSPEELETMEYRSKKALEWPVRIVTFPGADTCACCGTHVRRAGEVGLCKLLSVQKFREGVRVEMLFGRKALEYCNRILQQNHATSVLLSAKEEKTASYVQKLYDEKNALQQRLAALETAHNEAEAQRLAGAGDVLLFEEGLNPDSLRRLAAAVVETCGGLCACFSGTEEGGYAYCLGKVGGDLRALTKQMNTELHGRGGGKPFFTQGAVQAKRAEIEAFFAENNG